MRMQVWTGVWRRLAAVLIAVIAAGAVAACGSSSSSTSADAQTLLKETFSGSHKISSGVLNFGVTIKPSGSSTVSGPISLNLSGPFQSRGSGQLPASNFTISASALGHHGQLGVVSTGGGAYVILKGSAYQLPSSDFSKLQQGFASSSNGSTSTGGLAKFGIKPLDWLSNPTTVGSESVGGAATTHIRAQVNVSALLSDLNTFLQKASASAGTNKIPTTLPPAVQQQIAQKIKNPTVDIWTGNSDHTLRKLALNLNVPVSGQGSTELGGLTSAGIGITLQYSGLNQSQTITAPTNVQPFTQFAAKLQGVMQQVQGSFGGGLGAQTATGSGTATASGGSGTPNANNVTKYTQCIQKAAGDVTKMQKCASLLQGSGG
jgi:hypothetical protein